MRQSPDKVDLSTTIVSAVPLILVLVNGLGLKISIETQMTIAALVSVIVGYFVGKPSTQTKRLREYIERDNVFERDDRP